MGWKVVVPRSSIDERTFLSKAVPIARMPDEPCIRPGGTSGR